MSRVSVYTKEGYFIGDIRVATVRSWTLPRTGAIGKCEFEMSIYDAKATTKYIDFGKYILVRQSGLPDWAGVITPDQNWGYGSFKVAAYALEKILEFRGTPIVQIADSHGELFREILNLTNILPDNEKPIFPGEIFIESIVAQETLGDNAFSHCKAIAERSLNDFDVIHKLDVNGRIYLKGNWYEEKGIDTGFTLREGFNLELSDNIGAIQGVPWNSIDGYSDSSTPGTRLKFSSRVAASIARWGLYHQNVTYSGVTQLSTLQSSVMSDLFAFANGEKILSLTALNVGDTFSYLSPGNYVNVDLNRVFLEGANLGYNGRVKILGMEYDDLSDKMELAVEAEELYA